MKGFILLLFIITASASFANGKDSTNVDSDTVKVHSIKKAVILSAVVPGAGQIYNHIAMPKGKKKAFWKVPLIYGALGTASYFLIYNQTEQRNLKQEYTNRENENYISPFPYSQYNDAGVLALYNQHLDWRDLSILALAGVYFIQLVDAGVEAHFVSFDISEDLSLNLEPTLLNQRTAGLKLSFNFH